MMMRIKIIKKGYGHSVDQVLTVNEFEGGHLMAFGYAVPHVETKVETRPQAPPETRIGDTVNLSILQNGEQVISKQSFFTRRGRPKKQV